MALKPVSLSVAEGELVTVLGPNGAGKTTMLRAITRLVGAKGQVLFKGEDVSRLATHELAARGIIMVQEGRGLFAQMSIRENLVLGAYTLGNAAEETELEGVTLPQGAVIDVCIGSANRDEHRWERSEEFDIFRKRVPHISFAAGEHTCLGLHLARMETRVALECLLDRLTDITLLTEDNPHIYGQPFRSPTALPVTFDSAR